MSIKKLGRSIQKSMSSDRNSSGKAKSQKSLQKGKKQLEDDWKRGAKKEAANKKPVKNCSNDVGKRRAEDDDGGGGKKAADDSSAGTAAAGPKKKSKSHHKKLDEDDEKFRHAWSSV